MDHNHSSRRAFLKTMGGMGGASLLLAACGGQSATSATTAPAAEGGAATAAPSAGGQVKLHFLSAQVETAGYTGVIGALSKEFQQQNPSAIYEYEQSPQTDVEQKIQLLVASNSLPLLFVSPATGTMNEIAKKGLSVNIEQVFKDLGIFDTIKPVAADLVRKIGGGSMNVLPTELNIEGIWYNKQIFAENGLGVPATWDDMAKAAETLSAKGIQPFAASGEQGWPLTRLIGGYAARKYGADVMERVAKGELKLTDAGFVEAAKAVQDLGTKGYFGEGVSTVDYDTATDLFLQGKAAMFYMGSWVVGDFNNAERNQIGAENIGFFNTPTVAGGAGSADDWSMNTGLPIAIGQAEYSKNPELVGKWLTYVFKAFGERALKDQGLITGFTVATMPSDVPALTKLVQQTIDGAKSAFLYFEGYFAGEAQTTSYKNVQLLVTGDMSAEDFVGGLQQALEK